jgi:hypothetical protein
MSHPNDTPLPFGVDVRARWADETPAPAPAAAPVTADREVAPAPAPHGDTMPSTAQLIAPPQTFLPSDSRIDYSKNPPGRVSENLRRLMAEARVGSDLLSDRAKVGKTTIRRFLAAFEPPTNHPMLQTLARALAPRLRRPAEAVLEELVKGGSPTQFTAYQWSRITGEIGSRTSGSVRPRKSRANGATRAPANGATGAAGRAPSMAVSAVQKRVAKAPAVAPAAGRAVARPRPATAAARDAGALRTAVTTINMARMKGEKFVPMPVDQLTDLVAEALKGRGVDPAGVLVSADFADTF